MKNLRFFIFLLAISFIPVILRAQTEESDTASFPYWIEMMQDENINFYQVVKAFDTYWEGRPVTKGCGYKPFKRWEYSMRNGRIYPDGTRKPASYTWNAYFDYIKSYRDSVYGHWESIGPKTYPSLGYKGLGRINAIAFHPTNPDIFYIGAPSGGLWHTYDGGNTWGSNTDNLPTLGVSAIIVDYSNPNLIYIGSGDRDANDAVGMGVLRSNDSGLTWELWNNGMGEKIVGRLIQHPTNPSIILAATSGGIFKTIDGGANWAIKKTGNFKDIVFKPNNADIIYACSGANFFRSTDGGENFTQITNGLTGGQRAVVAVTPANPEYVYLLVSDNSSGFKGLYRSTDGGTSFVTMSNSPNILDWSCDGSGSGGQAWYDLEIAADPMNPNLIYAGGINIWKSYNGGETWQITAHWYGGCNVQAVHADHHVFEFSPIHHHLYVGNDGGIYSTANQGQTWTEYTSGLVISQIYKIGQDVADTSHLIIGMQDNGTSTLINNVWADTRGGDGMECIIDYQEPAYSYASLYYGDIARFYNNNGGYTIAAKGKFGITEDGDWITPYTLHVTDPNRMFIGYKNIWRGQYIRTTPQWVKISDNLAGNNNTNIRIVEQSQANPDILYFARWDNKLFRTDNANAGQPVWVNLTSLLPLSGQTPSALRPHPTKPDIIYMALGGKIYKSQNRGQSWTDISGSLPNVEYSSIAFYIRAHEGLYVASDIGVFYKDSTLTDWIQFSNGLPVDASIREIEIAYNNQNNEYDRIRAGTYGRGVWSSSVYRTPPTASFTSDVIIVPVTGQVHFKDISSGIPSSWQWTFEGGQPATSTIQNPVITYNNPGSFKVKLIVSNSLGIDSIEFQNYITVSNTILPLVGFYADNTIPCSGQIVRLYDTTLYGPISWHWQFQPNTIAYHNGTFYNSQNPVVQFNENTEYTITLTASNPNGTSSVTRQNYIHSGGYLMPFYEDFETLNFADRSWTVENPDMGITWDMAQVESIHGPTVAARMQFFYYYLMNQRDRLISPPLNFSNENKVILSFEHAYAQRYNQRDSLIVLASDDCGSTWTRIFASGPDGNGIFETAPKTESEFIPSTAEDWCGSGWGANCIQLDLSAWAGKPNCRIAFEAFNKLGNNLYIDNIVVSRSGVGMAHSVENTFIVSPNPSNGIFNITTPYHNQQRAEIYSTDGRMLFSKDFSNNNLKINVSSYPSGIYTLKIIANQQTYQIKLIKK
ncbi:MAG TPA: T9SS type A sorting domain-containing protein [Bacteroidales bacterium]|jgi:PKD repeat protein|nr:T9SS type A sorting domain-containing protein [Bacteroidales bacterium]MDI9574379.1 T9SS type A sorting domain-containing protein [Bacteroidota bacterium]OQC61696.1 MAG: Xyloglucanase Xgh74A precursor [Bacteroidetes bacterium ADurb.Bin012]MBP9511335.1 T9SS type A sorting domain-containing protein [Bacteroidales bacterium]MBP9587858.1 T9SS type A sorting domain-containing protein [Bacteroidales bacterium]